MAIISAGVIMNVIFALDPGGLGVCDRRGTTRLRGRRSVSRRGGLRAGLQPGDRILEIAGQ